MICEPLEFSGLHVFIGEGESSDPDDKTSIAAIGGAVGHTFVRKMARSCSLRIFVASMWHKAW
jgi:hypothetical protein